MPGINLGSIGGVEVKSVSVGSVAVKKISLGDSAIWSGGVRFSDNFNRADGALGANWVAIGSHAPVIAGNKADSPYAGGANSSVSYVARWSAPSESDDQDVAVTLAAPAGDQSGSLYAGVVLRAGAGDGPMVTVVATETGIRIVTLNSLTASTVRAETNGLTIAPGTKLRVTAVGNTYQAYLAGTQRISWTDTANVVSKGVNYRFVGIWISAATDALGSSSSSWAMDNWSGGDLM
ncbi:DUF7257 domain-containing protein [Nocardia arthritidis]|uniref:Uncharacterized protein n=1 Tax=Nocardia arthritidis TaxID=228602 RepID=A0A6G9YSW2_9NOCA|nr:hypothetical protein [Nocardia arthritidis]QIS16399.1 hypothetical protein F5544_42955 [Nocardia arthritidis]